jgi:hypothetical protein
LYLFTIQIPFTSTVLSSLTRKISSLLFLLREVPDLVFTKMFISTLDTLCVYQRHLVY